MKIPKGYEEVAFTIPFFAGTDSVGGVKVECREVVGMRLPGAGIAILCLDNAARNKRYNISHTSTGLVVKAHFGASFRVVQKVYEFMLGLPIDWNTDQRTVAYALRKHSQETEEFMVSVEERK